MYADFESILEPIQGQVPDPNVSSMRGVNVHKPSGWCIYSLMGQSRILLRNIEGWIVLASSIST